VAAKPPVDEDNALWRELALRAVIVEYAKLTKNSVASVNSVAK